MGPNAGFALLFTVCGLVGVSLVVVGCGLIFGWSRCPCLKCSKSNDRHEKQGSHLRQFRLRPEVKPGVYAYENDIEQGLRAPSQTADSSESDAKSLTSREASASKVPSRPDSLSLSPRIKGDRVLPYKSSVVPRPPANTYSPPTQRRPSRSLVPKGGVLGGPVTDGGPLLPLNTLLNPNPNFNSAQSSSPPKFRPYRPIKTQNQPSSPDQPSTPNWPLRSLTPRCAANPISTPSTSASRPSLDRPPRPLPQQTSTTEPPPVPPRSPDRPALPVSIPRRPMAESATADPISSPSANLGSLVIDGVLHPALRPAEERAWTQKPIPIGQHWGFSDVEI